MASMTRCAAVPSSRTRLGQSEGRRAVCTCSVPQGSNGILLTKKHGLSIARSKFDSETWRGFIGEWNIDINLPAASKKTIALRTWKWQDDNKTFLHHINIYDYLRPPAKQRDMDGLFEADFSSDHALTDEQMEEAIQLHPASRQVLYWANGTATIWTSTALPAVAMPGGTPSPGPWGAELFLQDGHRRWAAIALFDGITGDLTKISTIREYSTELSPYSPDVLKVAAKQHMELERPMRSPNRSELSANPSEWLTEGTPGKARSICGNPAKNNLTLQEDPVPCAWSPPDAAQYPDHSLTLLRDSMYLFAPRSLAPLKGHAHPVCRLEFGGRGCSQDQGFMRIIAEWDIGSGGGLSRLVKESY